METKKEDLSEGLKDLSTPELMDALREARKIESELQARGLAFAGDVLSKVDDFPTERLDECTVKIELKDRGGVLVINVPMHPMHEVRVGDNIADDHSRKLAVKSRFESLPQVARVDAEGTMNSGMMSLNVTLRSDQVPAQGSLQAVEEIRRSVGENLQTA